MTELTVSQFAKLANLPTATIYYRIAKGLLPTTRQHPYLIASDQLDRFPRTVKRGRPSNSSK